MSATADWLTGTASAVVGIGTIFLGVMTMRMARATRDSVGVGTRVATATELDVSQNAALIEASRESARAASILAELQREASEREIAPVVSDDALQVFGTVAPTGRINFQLRNVGAGPAIIDKNAERSYMFSHAIVGGYRLLFQRTIVAQGERFAIDVRSNFSGDNDGIVRAQSLYPQGYNITFTLEYWNLTRSRKYRSIFDCAVRETRIELQAYDWSEVANIEE